MCWPGFSGYRRARAHQLALVRPYKPLWVVGLLLHSLNSICVVRRCSPYLGSVGRAVTSPKLRESVGPMAARAQHLTLTLPVIIALATVCMARSCAATMASVKTSTAVKLAAAVQQSDMAAVSDNWSNQASRTLRAMSGASPRSLPISSSVILFDLGDISSTVRQNGRAANWCALIANNIKQYGSDKINIVMTQYWVSGHTQHHHQNKLAATWHAVRRISTTFVIRVATTPIALVRCLNHVWDQLAVPCNSLVCVPVQMPRSKGEQFDIKYFCYREHGGGPCKKFTPDIIQRCGWGRSWGVCELDGNVTSCRAPMTL